MTVDNLSRARIRASLRPLQSDAEGALAAPHGDHDLNDPAAPAASLRPAAVLVPLIARATGYTVLLTRRTEHLQHHAGQVSFPGGRLEDADDGPVGAALRETHEEIGLDPERVQTAGLLDDYQTVTRFLVTPVVGFVRPGFRLAPDASEVAEVFEMPLAHVLDPRNHRIHGRIHQGRRRRFYAFEYEGHYVWGATAGMLMNFYRRLHGVEGPARRVTGPGSAASSGAD